MANKVTIGQVNVRVRPDTSGVYQETKRALDAIEKKLGAIEVEVKADADSLNREVERARDSAQRQARRDAITFRVDLENDESIKRAIGQVRRELERLSEDEFKIDLDHDALNEFLDDLNEQFEAPKVINLDYKEGEAGLRALRREIEKIESEHRRLPFEFDTSEEGIRKALADVDEQLARQPMQLHVEPNVASVDKALREIDRRLGIDGSIKMEVATDEESLRRARHHLEELKEDYDDTTLDFHPEVSELARRLAQGKLAWLARSRIVNLIPLVNSAAARKAETAITALAGVRLLRSTFDRVWDLVKNLDKNIPLIGSIALAVQGLSAWLLAAASNTFALAQSLAQIGPLALTLPGILGGLTVGIGAYIAVLQDFNEVLPEIGDSLSDLQDEMSSRFWEQSAEAVRSSWLRVLPALRKGLLQTTDALSGWTNAMAESLGRHLPPTLPEMFDNLSRSIDIASKGADDFGRIIEILGRRGSEYLPRLARWFTDIQGNFANWLDTADRTGRLTRLIEQAIEQASQLGRVFYHTGGILADFAHAAELAGGTSLTDLANKLEQIHEVTSRPSFQAGLVRTFRAAHEAMDNIARVSGPRVHDFFVNLVDMMERNLPLVGETIGLLVGGIAEALSTDRFERGFNDFMRGLNSMARDLDPVWDDIGDGIGSVLSLAGDLATAFGPVLAAAFSLFSDVAQAVAPILGEIASILSARLVTVIETLHEPIIAVAEAFANLTLQAASVPGLLEGILLGFLALRAIGPIVDILEGARRALAVFGIGGKGKGAAKGGGGLFGGLTRSLSRLGPMLARIAPMLLRLGGIIGIVGGTLVSAYQESDRLRDALSRLWQAVVDAFEPVRRALGPLKEALSELLVTVMESVQQVGEALGIDIDISGIESFSQATGDLLALLVDYAIPGVAAFAEVLANLIAGTIMNWVIPAIQSLSAIISQFANWLSNVFIPEMQNVGAQIGIVWDWIRNKVSTVVSALVPIVAAGMAILQGNWSKAWAIVRKLVSSAWNAIRSTVRGGMDGAKATVNNGLAAIVNWFRQRWNAARTVVINAIARIRGTITNGISAAANAVSSFLSRIVKIFRSGWSQAVSATSAGWARVVATIAKFIGRALSVIRSLPSQAAGIVRSGAGAMVSAGASLISGLVSGIRSAASRVASAARSVVSSAITAARKALQINSPSKVFIGIGRYTGQGFVEGLLSEESEVEKAGRRVAEAAERGVKSLGDLSAHVGVEGSVSGNLGSGAGGGDTNIIINGANTDAPEETARAVNWSLRVEERGGKYRRRGR